MKVRGKLWVGPGGMRKTECEESLESESLCEECLESEGEGRAVGRPWGGHRGDGEGSGEGSRMWREPCLGSEGEGGDRE